MTALPGALCAAAVPATIAKLTALVLKPGLPAIVFALAFVGESGAQECATSVVTRDSVRVEYDSRAAMEGRSAAIVFERSDDGVIHAIEEATGRELWAFQPPELVTAGATRGLMTKLAVLRFDANGDGVIDAAGGDRVWLYFGLKRGGPHYYALDVSSRMPGVLWRDGADILNGLGEAWSTPTLARVRIGGASQNGERFVMIVGGGVGADAGTDAGPDAGAGNRLFMLDAADGRVLWVAGNQGSADRVLPLMTHGFAGRVAALDADGDELADRMYAADLGGRLWRFDIWNGRTRGELVTGGVIASLGATPPLPAAAPSSADARQFFNAPDVALIQPFGGDAYYNLAIGSGNASNSGTTQVRDRFYSVRDREPFTKRSQSGYDGVQPVFDANLTDITASAQTARVPEGAPGWKLDLVLNGAASGEKVLAEALTANGVVLFTTYQPSADSAAATCEEGGTNRIYVVRADSGTAALDLDNDARVTTADRFSTLTQQGVAGEPRIELAMPRVTQPPATLPPPSGQPTGPADPGAPGSAECFVGTERLTQCVPLDTALRTFWKRTLVN